MSAPQPLVLLGARSFAAEVADLAAEIPGVRVDALVENLDPARCGRPLEGLPVIWIDELDGYAATHAAVCALGSTHRQALVEEAARRGIGFATLVHPTARVSPRSDLGEGTIVSAGAVIGARTRIGRHVIVNRGALLGHHVVISDFVTLGPGANVASTCTVGERAYVGIGAVVLDHLTIGEGAVVGAGAVVTRDVPAHVQVVGVPARVVKEGVDGL